MWNSSVILLQKEYRSYKVVGFSVFLSLFLPLFLLSF